MSYSFYAMAELHVIELPLYNPQLALVTSTVEDQVSYLVDYQSTLTGIFFKTFDLQLPSSPVTEIPNRRGMIRK